MENLSGIPVLFQHGSADENVPTFHSRRMNLLTKQKNLLPPLPEYAELSGKGHWFDGVMTTPVLLRFYQDVLEGRLTKVVPQTFSLMVADPADMGPRYGLLVDQKVCSDQLGRLDVVTDQAEASWSLATSNIHRFHINIHETPGGELKTVVVDGHVVDSPPGSHATQLSFSRSADGSWIVCGEFFRPLVYH